MGGYRQWSRRRYTHVIPGNRRGPSPNVLYATVLAIGLTSDGVPYRTHATSANGLVDVTTVNTARARYSLQWYRKGARDAARRFAVWMYSPAGYEAAQSAALTVALASEVRQLDAIISAAWEERAGLDLDIGYLEKTVDESDIIETTPIRFYHNGHVETIEVTHGS